ncbi:MULTISPECIES: GNAT family N-acetyltransferase [unclassified Coleofasciculus]|uniref:GNAT family N-acetyltransferase n=1 Tax=unclassified Coleofasciculus TaxID=2692782 RepID=UPI001881FC71|nr:MULTISPECIES: GNAT family N-acetyltransferase [unclassified Coleofasciculus]MBE9125223.1 acetyltransferase [Coleofasciculus sp. LEGE 07081]MBE9148424.1 acetyltransferase [Coleofasciculus sp. LEGE 07092]
MSLSHQETLQQHVSTYQTFDPEINKVIAFRPVVLEEDLSLIHNWMNQPHVIPFWNLDFDLDRMRNHLEKALADTHQTLYIGLLNGVAMSYWESYWAVDDIVAKCYSAHPADQGIHLLIGEPEFLGKEYALPLLRAMTAFQFQHPKTLKIIAEPDSRNQKMIHVFKRCGFEFQTEIDLPSKRAALMFCHRQNFFRRWG